MTEESWIGRQIDHYEVLALVGRGGMGAVYRARHTLLGREAAIKVLHRDRAGDGEDDTRFVREAQSIASLRHAQIVQLYDFGICDEGYYMVLGHSL